MYRADIDGLRAVAVLPVVFHHAGFPLFSGGFVGVDVFFVISGFLITRILVEDHAANNFSILDFYERRVRRIIPALFAVLVVCLVLGALLLSPLDYDELSEGVLSAIFFVSNLWLWWTTTDYFSSAAELNFLLHTWSLAIEEQFYLIFPLLLWWLLSRSLPFAHSVVLSLAVLSLLVSAVAGLLIQDAAFFLAPFRFWELLIGAALALRPWKRSTSEQGEWIGLTGLLAILIPIFFHNPATWSAWFATVPASFGAAMIIGSGQSSVPLSSRVLAARPLVWIGLISYSLYLWHWPVIVALRHQTGEVKLSLALSTTAILVSFLLAWASWAFVESPFRRSGERRIGRGALYALAGSSALALILVSFYVTDSEGFPARLPTDARAIYAIADERKYYRTGCRDVALHEHEKCQTGDGPVDILLWGDSHAAAAWEGLTIAADQAGLTARIAWSAGCPPLLGIDQLDRDSCGSFNAEIFEALEKRSDIPVIVMAARWSLAAEGRRMRGETGGDVLYRESGSTSSDFSPEANFDVFQRGVDRTIEALVAQGRRIVILGNVPEIGFSVPDRLAFATWKRLELPEGPTRESVIARHARLDEVFARISRPGSAIYLDLAPIICETTCQIQRGGKPLYFDDDHFSKFGSVEVLTPLLSEAFHQTINDGAGYK